MVLTHGLRWRPFSTAFFASSAAPIITDGFEVLVHEVIAAIVTAPWSRVNVVPSASVTSTGSLGRPPSFGAADRWSVWAPPRRGRWRAASEAGKDSATASSYPCSSASADVVGERAAEGLLGVGDLDPVLRPLRAGDRGTTVREVELELLGVARLAPRRVVPEPLLLGVGLDQRELLVGLRPVSRR